MHLTSPVAVRIENPISDDTLDALVQQVKGVRRNRTKLQKISCMIRSEGHLPSGRPKVDRPRHKLFRVWLPIGSLV